MHTAAMDWLARYRTNDRVTVLDIGGRNINGSPRTLFPNAEYTVLDILDGPGVDIVADAATWSPRKTYDVVICAEVFEHTDVWPAICRTAFDAVRGVFIATMAGPGRAPHSAIDGGLLRDGEYYSNIRPETLREVLVSCGFSDINVDQTGDDVRAVGSREV
ncbi:methyltransferase domain-containing protein [Amycolatopsis palatopharyngis]|uniref:methyltransferase domain-containing protein n=1 Tax=Amycolatopsis palatopharyngis TaxID=187982 RepID=UPI000E268A4B|nr:methyltransferase domain-containing protein [Amycolatopsis palatopharyngis]